MAPTPVNLTQRLFLGYTSAGIQHTACFRPSIELFGSDQTTWAQSVAAFMSTAMLETDTVLAAKWSDVNADFSLPIPFTPQAGTRDPFDDTWREDPESVFLTIPMRSTSTGVKGRFCMFSAWKWGGAAVNWPSDNRWNSGEQVNATTFINDFKLLVAGSTPYISGLILVDGTGPVAYDYLNLSKNGYWQRKQRG